MAINIQKMEEDFNAFFEKYKNCDFEGATDEADYVADANKVLSQYVNAVESEEERHALSGQCAHLGCKIMMYTDNVNGPQYYRMAIRLWPDSYDVHWGYYTTLEEIVENEEYATPELIQDAIECLTFCIGYCDTPELCEKYCVRGRYVDLGRAYMMAGEFAKAKECAGKSLAIEYTEYADMLYQRAEKLAGMEEDIDGFYKKYKFSNLRSSECEAEYVSAADRVLKEYESVVHSKAEKLILSKFCGTVGSGLMMYAYNLTDGRRFYRKSIELRPDSYNAYWGYYTTLEEIVENEKYATPELIQDAIECLTFCIDYCDTPELQAEYYIQCRYHEIARVYMAAKDYEKAKKYAEMSLEIEWDEDVEELAGKASALMKNGNVISDDQGVGEE